MRHVELYDTKTLRLYRLGGRLAEAWMTEKAGSLLVGEGGERWIG